MARILVFVEKRHHLMIISMRVIMMIIHRTDF